MEFLQNIVTEIGPVFKNLYVQMGLLLGFATVHGYLGAWLAVRMLFRPRAPIRLLGLTVFPQGMIPRHRDKLANAIGKAVGEELVSQETILQALTGKDFLRKKIQHFIDSYIDELLSQDHPSLIEALPGRVRTPVLDAVSALQIKLAKQIRGTLRSEESLESIRLFVDRRVDDVLGQRVSKVVSDERFESILSFLDDRVRNAISAPTFEVTIKDFVSRRLDDLVTSETPLREMFTEDAVHLLKEKAAEQIEPAIHHLTEVAAAERTRAQIGALIKREVHEYYENLPFFKKMFVSRENLLGEVDDLVNESLPKRIEETLRGEFFASEAVSFINSAIDNALARPLPVALGQVAPEQLASLKSQVVRSVLSLMKSEDTAAGISAYLRETLEKFRPHSIDAILQLLHSEAESKLKLMLSRGLLDVLGREETSNTINEIVGLQIDRLLSMKIGKLAEHVPEEKIREAGRALSEAIVGAISAKLPEAIAEFDVAGLVREKIQNYPPEKLEALVLSVAKEHLRKIEMFGALFGFLIGLVQVLQFYFYAH
jgi:uncharacterized membrane protein YheB (UPF0754 family)